MGKSLQVANVPNAAVFRADTSGLVSIPTGLVGPTWFTSFSETFDTAGAFNTSTGRFQPTVAGYYQINARASYSSNGITATYVGVSIGKNGTSVAYGAVGSNGEYPQVTVSDIVYLNGSTDYVQVGTLHNASGTVNDVSGSISGALIRPA